MSQLEERIKAHLVPLLRGDAVVLDKAAQTELALWIDKTACVFEFSDVHSQIATAQDRDAMRSTLEPAPNSEVWIARYAGSEWKGRIRHFGGTLRYSRSGNPLIPQGVAESRVRADVMVIGNFLGFVLGGDSAICSEMGLSDVLDLNDNPLQRVWPLAHDSITAGTGDELSDEDAIALSNIVLDAFGERQV